MPAYVLSVKGDLENIQSLTPLRNNYWKFDLQSLGGAEERKDVTVSELELQPLDDSRGEAHFIMKWPFSREQAYIKLMVPHKAIRTAITAEDSGSFVPILAMECRNCEPTNWHPSVDFVARSVGNTVFESVDLRDRDWADFDEENDVPVSVTNLEFKIEPLR